ncbi:hypothetical protein KY284_027431 [Solanum tuberosum]|nr:hypothetical protein KY284_027431 [Solanum tuberosum]
MTSGNQSSSVNNLLMALSKGSNNKVSLPPLNFTLTQDNYLLWETTIKYALEIFNWEKYLDSTQMSALTVVSPTTDSSTNQTHVPNPEYESWKSCDRVILIWIKTTIDPSILGHINQSRTAAEAWTSLHHIFQTQSLAWPVTNYELVTYILCGLDPSYGPFRTTINLRTLHVTCEVLFGLLLQEEQKLVDDSAHVTLSANIVNRQSFQSRPSYNSSLITNQPQQRNPKRNDNRRPSNRPICKICEKLGHVAKNCYNRYNDQYSPTNAPRPQANSVTSSSTFLDPSWCLDSSATNHVTANVGNLFVTSDYFENDSLAVGNGSKLPITHIGSFVIPFSSRSFHLKNVLTVLEITTNLLSVSQFTRDNNFIIEFHPSSCFIKDLQRKVLLRGMIKHGLYRLAAPHLSSQPRSFLAVKVPLQTWHDRMAILMNLFSVVWLLVLIFLAINSTQFVARVNLARVAVSI